MSMISPETFAHEHADKTYEELIEIRNDLFNDIKRFEATPRNEGSGFIICPGPDVVYQMNHEYLSKICWLIVQKFQKEQELED